MGDDSSSDFDPALLEDVEEEEEAEVNELVGGEAEEVEEEDEADDRVESNSEAEIAPFDEPQEEGAAAAADVDEAEDLMDMPAHKSHVADDDNDDAFLSLAGLDDDFASIPKEKKSKAKKEKKEKRSKKAARDDGPDAPDADAAAAAPEPEAVDVPPTDLADPHLPSDPATLELERRALEGPGAGQLRLELRALETTGMKLLRKSAACHEFGVFLRRLLQAHKSTQVRVCLMADVHGKARGEYLLERLRRRFWSVRRGTTTADISNDPLPSVCGAVTLQLPLLPTEACLAGATLPDDQALAMGRRAAGQVLHAHLVHDAVGAEQMDGMENLVVLAAKVDSVLSSNVASGSYGSYVASVKATAQLVPAREGGTLTGVVTKLTKPQYQLNRPVSSPTVAGEAEIDCGMLKTVVQFGAEVPARAWGVGRVWVVRLVRNKERQWVLQFAADPFLLAAAGDHEDALPLSAKAVSALNVNRKPVVTPQFSKCWAAVDDAQTGFRVVRQLPDSGYAAAPASLEQLLGDHVFRGTAVRVCLKRPADENINYAHVGVSDHEVSGKSSQRARVEVRLEGKQTTFTVSTPFSGNKKRNAQLLCIKVARCLEVLCILVASGVNPQVGTFSFAAGGVTHDDTEPRPQRTRPGAKRKADAAGKAKKPRAD